MKELIIASNNSHKIIEIKEILKGLDFNILSLADKNIDIDVEEDGDTFEANARKKSEEICKYLLSKGEKDFYVLSDDSGLEVDILKGEPGVYSARYAGEHGNDSANNEKLLSKLEGLQESDRTGRFICAIALVDSNMNFKIVRGEAEGYILKEYQGSSGFGYDPLFFSYDINKSFGIATSQEKNSISHRAKALKKLRVIMEEM